MVKDVENAVLAVKKISSLNRSYCRKMFEKYYTAECMAENYIQIYKKVIAQKTDKAEVIRE